MLWFLANTGISISNLIPLGALEGVVLVQPGEEVAAEAHNSSPSTHRQASKEMEPGPSQWCVVGKQEVVALN